jgi:hypothetical protein
MPVELSLDTLRGSGTTLMAKMALAKLSEDLVSSPAVRADFIKDPSRYIAGRFGQNLSANEQNYFEALAQMYADGNCCTGCNCGTPMRPGSTVQVTAGGR